MASWRLITGITGLLGQYLLCDALLRREPVAVLVRARRGLSAETRVDRILDWWEQRLSRCLPRPVVLTGDLRQSDLGLSNEQVVWFRTQVGCVIHSAANVSFHETPSREIHNSNVGGTRNLVEFCHDSAVQDFHFVSTAYACGKQKSGAVVREELHSIEGSFGNDYEHSKCTAENIIASSAGEFSRTIYRPSIIIGESCTGMTPSFNAIYAALKLIWMLLGTASDQVTKAEDILKLLQLKGDESRNLVPVDWVAHTIGTIVRSTNHHGKIYHITNPQPTFGSAIISAMAEVFSERNSSDSGRSSDVDLSHGFDQAAFVQHMSTYQAYFASDPQFDNAQLLSVPGLPSCPIVDTKLLKMAFRYAIDQKFLTPQPTRLSREAIDLRHSLDGLAAHSGEGAASGSDGFSIRLCLTGSGGGNWRLKLCNEGLCVESHAESNEETVEVYGPAASFAEWLRGRSSLKDGLIAGQFLLTGLELDQPSIARILGGLREVTSEQNARRIGAATTQPEASRSFQFVGQT